MSWARRWHDCAPDIRCSLIANGAFISDPIRQHETSVTQAQLSLCKKGSRKYRQDLKKDGSGFQLVNGRPPRDGITEPLMKNLKRAVTKWYKNEGQCKADRDLCILESELVFQIQKYCREYRHTIKSVLNEQPTADSRKLMEKRRELRALLVNADASVAQLSDALAQWWALAEPGTKSNNLKKKRLYMFSTTDLLGDGGGGISVMLSRDKARMTFMATTEREYNRVMDLFDFTSIGIVSARIQHTPVTIRPKNFEQGNVGASMEPVFKAGAAEYETLKHDLKERMTKATMTRLLQNGSDSYDALYIAKAEELRANIQLYVRRNMCDGDESITGALADEYQPIIVLSYDKKKGCQVHLVRGRNVPTKATLSMRWDKTSNKINADVSFALFPHEVEVLRAGVEASLQYIVVDEV